MSPMACSHINRLIFPGLNRPCRPFPVGALCGALDHIRGRTRFRCPNRKLGFNWERGSSGARPQIRDRNPRQNPVVQPHTTGFYFSTGVDRTGPQRLASYCPAAGVLTRRSSVYASFDTYRGFVLRTAAHVEKAR